MKEIQHHRTWDLISLAGLVMLCVSVIAYIVSQSFVENQEENKAYHQAEVLSSQLMRGGVKEPNSPSEDRGPASTDPATNYKDIQDLGPFGIVGKIGKDPWGRAFRYQLLKDDKGKSQAILVWSEGPNQKSDTEPAKVSSLMGILSGNFSPFQGDDIGFVRNLN